MFAKYIPRPSRREYVTFILLFVEITIFSLFVPNFFTADNFQRVIQNAAEIAFISIGMTIVMLLGGIDLSVGSVMGVIAIVAGHMMQSGINSFLILLVSIVTGSLLGLVNGVLVGILRIPDMIVTIATMNIWRAVIFMLLGGRWLTGLLPDYGSITRARVCGVPLLLALIVAVYILFYYLLMYQRFGRHIYAIGSNLQAATLNGINVRAIKIASYCVLGGIVAVSAMLYIARMGSVEMTIGNELPISCIAAVTLGGIGVKGAGKRGSVIGTLAGVMFIAFLRNGIVILGIPSLLENSFVGGIIIFSILFDTISGHRRSVSKSGREAVG
jgi:ribose transport system permease protein/AI-2 transport system permease protein